MNCLGLTKRLTRSTAAGADFLQLVWTRVIFLCRAGSRPMGGFLSTCVCLVSTLIIFSMYHPLASCWQGVKWLLCLYFLEVIATFFSHRRLSTHTHWNDLNDCLCSPSWAFFDWRRTDLSLQNKQANAMTNANAVMWNHKIVCWK